MERQKQLSAKEIKDIECNILKYIDLICKENGLIYFLEAGTLLGAVRHRGFIPWDDDIDIAMPRDDYERLIDIIEKDGKYAVSTYKNDSDCILPFAKVFDPKTIIKWKIKYPSEAKYGIWVDLFPLDTIPDNIMERYWFQFRLRIVKSLYEHLRNQYFQENNLKNCLILRIANFSNIRSYIIMQEKLLTKYRNRNTKYLMNAYGMKGNYHKIPKNFFGDSIKLFFEEHMYPVPNQYDKYLTMMYGNYMELPSKDERKSIHIIDAYRVEDYNV